MARLLVRFGLATMLAAAPLGAAANSALADGIGTPGAAVPGATGQPCFEVKNGAVTVLGSGGVVQVTFSDLVFYGVSACE